MSMSIFSALFSVPGKRLFSSASAAVAAAALCCAGTPFAAAAEAVRFAGSDFLAGTPEELIGAEIRKISGEEAVSSLHGSTVGLRALRAGTADFAVLMLPDDVKKLPEVASGEWSTFPLAYQVAYVVVSAANPASEISFDALASIFGNFAQKHADRWQSVGVEGFSSVLQACVGDLSRTNAVSFFQHKALPRFQLRPNVRTLVSDEGVFREIVNSPGTIGVVGSPVPAEIPVKALAVADTREDANATPYSPSFTNIYNGDYPLSIPVHVVYPSKNHAALKPVLSFLYSQELAAALSDVGFLPLEPRVREQIRKWIDNKQ